MTERIFGPFGDTFDGAFSRLEADVAKSETEAEMLRMTLERFFHSPRLLVGDG